MGSVGKKIDASFLPSAPMDRWKLKHIVAKMVSSHRKKKPLDDFKTFLGLI